MKNQLIFVFIALLAFTSCKKDKEETTVDPRDKYVGTYSGTQTTIIPGASINDVSDVVNIITKSSTNSNQILVSIDGEISKATLSGDKYIYDKYTEVYNNGTTTFTAEFNGSGSIQGNTITETGTVTMSYLGEEYPGTWTCVMTKQ